VAGSRRRQQTESAAPPVEADEGATGDHDEMLDESIDDGIDVTETGETEVDETDVDETEVDETDVDETDVDETDETEVDAEEEETDGTEAGAGVAAEDTGSGGDEEEPDGKIADEQDEKGK
jgi:hypothetical protein